MDDRIVMLADVDPKAAQKIQMDYEYSNFFGILAFAHRMPAA